MKNRTLHLLMTPEKWPEALERWLQVPMEVRSRSRIGFLAAPRFLSGFIRLAFAAGIGIIGAESQRPYLDPRAAIQQAADFSSDARREALEATSQKQLVRGARADLHRANKQPRPEVALLQRSLSQELAAAERQIIEDIKAAGDAAARASNAAKQARQAHGASDADKHRAIAERALSDAKQASDKARQTARQAVLLGNIATALADGNTPESIADQARKTVAMQLQAAEAADKKASDALAQVGPMLEDMARVHQQIEEWRAAADEAVATIGEAQKMVAELRKHIGQAKPATVQEKEVAPPAKKHRRKGRRLHAAHAALAAAGEGTESTESAAAHEHEAEDDSPPTTQHASPHHANEEVSAGETGATDSPPRKEALDHEDVADELVPAPMDDESEESQATEVAPATKKRPSPAEIFDLAEQNIAAHFQRAGKASAHLVELQAQADARLKSVTKTEERAIDTEVTATASAGNTSALTFLGFVAWITGRFAARRAKAKTDLRYKSLPFSVRGLDEALDGSTKSCRAIQVRVVWQTAPPEGLTDRLSAFDAKAQVVNERDAIVVERAGLSGWLAATNHRAFRWLDRLFFEVLVPLHAQNPIARVEISATGPSDSEEEDSPEDSVDSDATNDDAAHGKNKADESASESTPTPNKTE